MSRREHDADASTRARDDLEAERKKLLDELERQKHQYQAIFDTLPQLIWLKDERNVIVRANAAAAASIGLEPADVEGRPTGQFYPDAAKKYHGDDMEVIQSGNAKLDIIERYEPAPGDVRWVRTDKTPYRDAAGKVVGVVVSSTDVTGWKRGEEERARLYEQLKQMDVLKSQFFANVSHELRTPLTLILAPVEKLLTSGALDAGIRAELEMVYRNAQSLLKHVNDLLDIAKLDAKKMGVTFSMVDFNAIVRATASQFESLAKERRISLSIETGAAAFGEADTEKLERILGNVLSNAFRFTPIGGVVRCAVHTSAQSDTVIVEVADSGPGVDPPMREAIFERFRQADGGIARRYGGTGLGLAIAKELVNLHGGRICVDAAPEGGALFTIELPRRAKSSRSEGDVGVAASSQESLAESPASAFAREFRVDRTREHPARTDAVDTRARVLVVEDNPEMNAFIAREISDDHRVTSAFDGEEGLRIAAVMKPDLVLSDVMMPGLDGLALLGALRTDPELSSVPVIFLTARADEAMLVAALEGGADDFITKPFSSRELKARVRGHLELVQHRREVIRRQEEAALLRAAVKARDVFLSVASHELRTPLTTLQLNLQLIARLPSDREQQRTDRLAVAMRACRQMTKLVNTLLDVARVVTGHMELDKAEVDLCDVIRELRCHFEGEIAATGSSVELRLVEPAVGLWDRLRLEQVLSNLLSNALKFGRGNPIVLECTADSEWVHVSVQDRGVGIAPEDRERVFGRFEQAVASREYGGLGLGLWIAQDIVARHEGFIRVESTPGVGTTFTVDLPRFRAAASVTTREPVLPIDAASIAP